MVFISMTMVGYSQNNLENFPEGGCEPTGIKTDPENYSNPQDPPKDRLWDWRQEEFTIYIVTNGNGTLGTPVSIINPFYDQSGNPNTYVLSDAQEKNFEPIDGWELLYQNFGTPQQGVSTPFFILYNRYNGTLRAFVNIINSGEFPYTAAGLELSYVVPSGTPTTFPNVRQTAALNQLGKSTFAPNEFQRDAKHFSPNYYENSGVNDNPFWLFADYSTLYDPCTCGLEADWYFSAGLISQFDITLDFDGMLEQVVNANPNNNNPDETSVSDFAGAIQEYASFGAGIIGGVSSILDSGNDGFEEGSELGTTAAQFVQNAGGTTPFGNQTTPKIGDEKRDQIADILSSSFAFLGPLNLYLNTASTLITTVLKLGEDFKGLSSSDPKSSVDAASTTRATQYNLEATISGNMTINASYELSNLRVPGTRQPGNTGAIDHRQPIYDEIVGAWNLFEQPKFESLEYRAPMNLIVDEEAISTEQDPTNPFEPATFVAYNNGVHEVFPSIKQLKLTNVPKIMINPASGLELVDVKYQIVFDTEDDELNHTFDGMMRPGPFEYWKDVEQQFTMWRRHNFYETTYSDREAYTTAMGYQLSITKDGMQSSEITTPYLAQSCITKYPILSYSNLSNPRLRVKLVVKPIADDPNSKVDEVIFIHTFPGQVKPNEETLFYEVEGTVYLNSSDLGFQPVSLVMPFNSSEYLFGYSGNNVLFNEEVSGNYTVIGDIRVLDNLTFTSGNHVIAATGNITIDRSLLNLPINTQVTFQAAKNIYVNPEAAVEPEIVLEINPNAVLDCQNASEVYPTTEEIVTFCKSNLYDERSRAEGRKGNEESNWSNDTSDPSTIAGTFDFQIYPNPAQTYANLIFSDATGDEIITILDMAGRKVQFDSRKTSRGVVIELNGLQQGVYHVLITSLNGSSTKQLTVIK